MARKIKKLAYCAILIATLVSAVWGMPHSPKSGFTPQNSSSAAEQAPRECNFNMFTPNYAAELGVLQGGSWPKFPIRVWIDVSTVQDKGELEGLKKGLRSWSNATGGVLGVSFTDNRTRSQVEVKMVDSLPGGRRNLMVLGLSTIQTEGAATTGVHLQIVHPSPEVLRVMGTLANVHLTSALMTQRIAAHEMGHVLMGTADRHPSSPRAVLQQDNITVMLPSAIDVNTAKVKYCSLFRAYDAPTSGGKPGN
jgi:hypothetical protein